MIEYTVREYEQEDFDAVDNMTNSEAIDILEGLPRGWFPHNLPKWSGRNVTDRDYDNYKICTAIKLAVKALEEVK